MKFRLVFLISLFSLDLQAFYDIASLQDPFFRPKILDGRGLLLQAVINERVKINSKWYAPGDMIEEYLYIGLKNQKVILKANEKIIKLDIKKKNEKILIE